MRKGMLKEGMLEQDVLKEPAQGTCSRNMLKEHAQGRVAEHGSTRDTNVQVIASARSAFVTCEHRSKTLGAYSVKCWRARVAECRRAALSTGVTEADILVTNC